jgi:hypothetical protein
MDEPPHLPSVKGTEADATEREPDDAKPRPPASSQPKSTASSARFVGSAMKSLFESSDVSIKRDDETRVMSRAQDTLEELQRRHPELKLQTSVAPVPPKAAPVDERAAGLDRAVPESAPPGPRVDVMLWLVLAAGLFAIAGWMIASGL